MNIHFFALCMILKDDNQLKVQIAFIDSFFKILLQHVCTSKKGELEILLAILIFQPCNASEHAGQ